VPANLEEQKLLATGVYGTNLVGVRGNYDDVNRLCTQLAETRPWAFVNVNLRPYYAEGSKTLAYETVEQLGWELPDRIVCPIASGSLFTKLGRGFQEWLDIGLVEGGQPVFNGAQAQGCSPVATAFAEGWDVCKPQKPETIAKSLAIGDPADGPYAVEHARATGGRIDAVDDDEIRDSIGLLAETTGIFTETAGGVTVGVLRKLAERGEIASGERVVVYLTGEGLKTLDAARDRFQMHEIDPDLESFESVFEHQEVVA
jgi:threonine synthase